MMKSWIISKIPAIKHLTVLICAISLIAFGISGCDSSQPGKADPVSNTQEADRETISETQQAQIDQQAEETDETLDPEPGIAKEEESVIAEEKKPEIAEEKPVEADDGDWPLVYLTFNTDGGVNDGGGTYAGDTGYPTSPDGFEVFAFDTGNVNAAYDGEDGFRIGISDTGSEDWHVQLKKNGIRVENGKWYKVSFDAKSSINRSIVFSMQRDGTADEDWRSYSGTKTVELGNEWKPYTILFHMTDETDEKAIYNFALGTVGGSRISRQHTINMKNMKVEMLEDSWLDQLRQGDNLLKNPNFEYEDIGWETAVVEPGAANVKLENGKAVFDISNVGTLDWNVQLKQNSIPLEKGYNYRLTFKASSTAARSISIGFMDNQFVNWYGGNIEGLNAGEERTVAVEFYMDKDTNHDACMFISMGKIENVDTPASVITLSELSLVKLPGRPETAARSGGGGGGGDAGGWWRQPIFKLGSWEGSYWGGKVGQRSVVDDDSYLIEILDTGSEEWHIQLQKKGIVLEQGRTYEMSFEARSSIDRKISCMLQKDGTSDDDWTPYSGEGGQYQLSDSWQTFSREFTMTSPTDENVIYNISLGAVDGRITTPHNVYIRNVKYVDVTDRPIASIPVGEEMLEGEWIFSNQFPENSITESDNVITASIQNLGENDYDVQVVKKDLTLEEGCTYEFKCFADFDNGQRVIKVGIMQDGTYEWYGGTELELSDNTEEYTFKFTMDSMDKPAIKDGMLAINLGKIEGRDTPDGTVTLKDLSLKKIPESTEKPVEPDDAGLEMIANVEDNMLNGMGLNLSTDGGASAELDGKKITIANVGTEDYHVQLKSSSGLKLEKGAAYEIKADASFEAAENETDETRTIIFGLMSEKFVWYGGTEEVIGKDESPIQATFTMEQETDANAQFVISMGQIKADGVNISTPTGTITLSNISIVKKEKDEPEKPEDPDLKLIADGDDNMLKGKKLELYVDENNNASAKLEGTAITIDRLGEADYHVQLKCGSGLDLVQGATYEIKADASFKNNEGIDDTRKIIFGFMSPSNHWYGGPEVYIEKGGSVIQEEFTMRNASDANAQFVISMGQMDGSTPTGTITLSNISIVKTGDPKLIAENVKGNILEDNELHLIKNEGVSATQDETGTKIEIDNVGTNSWDVQLVSSGLNLEEGATYEIKADASFKNSDGEDDTRKIVVGFNSQNNTWYGGSEVDIKNDGNPIQATFTMWSATDPGAKFVISMGKTDDDTPTGTITLSNISIVKTGEADPDITEEPELIANFDGNMLKDNELNLIKNEGGSANRDETGTKIEIENVGTDSWHVQLVSYGLNLEEGATYEIKADASFMNSNGEDDTRKIIVGFNSQNGNWYGGPEVYIEKGGSSIQESFTMRNASDANAQFVISMGKTDENTPTGTITLSNISVVKKDPSEPIKLKLPVPDPMLGAADVEIPEETDAEAPADGTSQDKPDEQPSTEDPAGEENPGDDESETPDPEKPDGEENTGGDESETPDSEKPAGEENPGGDESDTPDPEEPDGEESTEGNESETTDSEKPDGEASTEGNESEPTDSEKSDGEESTGDDESELPDSEVPYKEESTGGAQGEKSDPEESAEEESAETDSELTEIQ